MQKKRLTREESKQQTREELIKIASKTFAKQGFYATSVDHIAEEAGYSKGAVYSNFGSKDDLFLAVFSENQQQEIHHLKQMAKNNLTLDEFIHAVEQNHQQGRDENEDWGILKLEFLLYAIRNKTVREKLIPILKETRLQITNLLKGFNSLEKEQTTAAIEKLAFLLLSLDIGIAIQSFADESSIPDNVFSEGLKRLLKT